MRKVALLAALSATVVTAGTRVVDTMRYADGRLASGWLTISWPSFSVGGASYATGVRRHQVVNGVLDVDLVPVDAAAPSGILYTVRVAMENAPTATEYWYIPTSPTIITLAAARVVSPTIDTDLLALAALNCMNGEIIKRTSGVWACGADAGGITGASNLGGGTAWFKQLSGTTLQFHTAAATAPVTVSLASDVVTIACPTCEVTTARGAVSGYAPLDASMLLPLANMPVVTPTKGGTGANLTATAGRFLRGDGSVFGLSALAAAGSGACSAGQYVTAGNDNAAPTCAQVGYGQLSGVPSTFAPAAHASAHQHGGADQVATATPSNNAIPKASGTGTLAAGWLLGAAASTELPIDGTILVRSGGVAKSAYFGSFLQFSSDHVVHWKDGTNAQAGAVDTQLYRNGVSTLKLGDGSAGTGTLVANLNGNATTASELAIPPAPGEGISISGTTALTISVDTATVPQFSTGAGAPSANCTAGRVFYLDTTNTRFFRCSGTNVWTEVARISSGSGAPASGACDAAAEEGTIYYRTDNTSGAAGHYGCAETGASSWAWVLLGGGVTGTANEITVSSGVASIAATFDISGKTSTKSVKTGTAAPGTCAVGELFYDTDAAAGSNFFGCTATNVWTLQGGGGVSTITAAPAAIIPLHWPTSTGTGAVTTVANRVFLVPFTITGPMRVGRINLEVTTPYAAGGNAVMGIYNAACNTLLASGAVTTAWESIGVKSLAFAATADLTAGGYFLALASDSTTLQMRIYSSLSTVIPIWHADSVSLSSIGYATNTATGGSTLPATCGGITEQNWNIPLTVIKP